MTAAAVLGAVFIACAVIGAVVAPDKANPGFTDAAAALAFVGLVAVAIERLIEGLFTILSGPLGQWWPLSVVKAEFDVYEQETDKLLGPVFTTAKAALVQARDAAGAGTDKGKEIAKAIAELDDKQTRLAAQLADAKAKLVPGSARLQRVSEISTAMSQHLSSAVEVASEATANAQTALKTATDAADRALLVISSIQDNPARRLASISLGASLGMLVAGGVGLNLFVATLADDTQGAPALIAGKLGIVLTGIVIGLGSNPTHEIVKSLQKYKEGRTPDQEVDRSPSDAGDERLAGRRAAARADLLADAAGAANARDLQEILARGGPSVFVRRTD